MIAFISGPYRSKNGRTVRYNVRQAEKYALKYWTLGYAVICPHLNTAFFDGELPDHRWLEGDLEFIDRLKQEEQDIIVMIPGWEDSEGSCAELRRAAAIGLNVIEEEEL